MFNNTLHRLAVNAWASTRCAPAQNIKKVLSELARQGVVNIREAYGNWKNQNLKPWKGVSSTSWQCLHNECCCVAVWL